MPASNIAYAEAIAVLGEERGKIAENISALQDQPPNELNELRGERYSRQERVLSEAIQILVTASGSAPAIERWLASLAA